MFVEHYVEVVILEEGRRSGGSEIRVEVPAYAVCSVVVPVALGQPRKGISVAQVQSMAIWAARGAADERRFGQADARAKRAWTCWEHECGLAAIELGVNPPAFPPDGTGFKDLIEVICSSAWGATNERQFGSGHEDSQDAWARFYGCAKKLAEHAGLDMATSEDLTWMVFNTSWAVVNEQWFGAESADCQNARGRAEQHISSLGGDTVILRCLASTLAHASDRAQGCH